MKKSNRYLWVFATGKSFLAHGLSSKLRDYDKVATDNFSLLPEQFTTQQLSSMETARRYDIR